MIRGDLAQDQLKKMTGEEAGNIEIIAEEEFKRVPIQNPHLEAKNHLLLLRQIHLRSLLFFPILLLPRLDLQFGSIITSQVQAEA